jgi:hypothetical protein
MVESAAVYGRQKLPELAGKDRFSHLTILHFSGFVYSPCCRSKFQGSIDLLPTAEFEWLAVDSFLYFTAIITNSDATGNG